MHDERRHGDLPQLMTAVAARENRQQLTIRRDGVKGHFGGDRDLCFELFFRSGVTLSLQRAQHLSVITLSLCRTLARRLEKRVDCHELSDPRRRIAHGRRKARERCHAVGTVRRKHLRDHTAHGKSHHMGPTDSQVIHQALHVNRHVFERVGRRNGSTQNGPADGRQNVPFRHG